MPAEAARLLAELQREALRVAEAEASADEFLRVNGWSVRLVQELDGDRWVGEKRAADPLSGARVVARLDAPSSDDLRKLIVDFEAARVAASLYERNDR